MKPLILILLAAVWGQAQTIADLARIERARQAKVQSTITVTTDDLKKAEPAEAPAPAPAEADKAATEATTAAPAPPVDDPVAKWNEEMGGLRAKIRSLQDQESALQLQINDLTNRVFAPVTSQSARAQSQSALDAAQRQLATVRADMASARLQVQHMEEVGPPAALKK
jgi:predicted  nucleic acid-binding Zn-ribbon protein